MVCRPDLLLEKYKNHAPACYKLIDKIYREMGTKDYQKVLEKEYPKMEKTSVDFGLFEKLKPGSQWELPVDIGWVDLGTWGLIYHGLDKDENGNVILGGAELIDTKNSLIFSKDEKTIGAIGLNDMIIVDTPKGLLVCPLKNAPKVKQLYKNLYEK
jgi:mannose-1-phosphate guanylyltransferase